MRPLVTVLIPAYNAEATIKRAIDSVLIQDYPSFEIVVIDDGSRDATSDVVASYDREDIHLRKLPKNLGECGAMNAGIAVARGGYVAFLDADDEWLPGKLSKQVDLLEANPRAVMATCGCLFCDASGAIVERFGMRPEGFSKDEIWRSLLRQTCIAKPCVVARTAALRNAGLFDPTLRVSGDQDMWIKLAIAGEVEFIPEYLTVAHVTAGSLTHVYRQDEDKYGLMMVRRQIDACRSRLSDSEIRAVMAERFTALGRNVYAAGRVFRGAVLLTKAIMRGGSSSENLWYIVTASPPARKLKRLLRHEKRQPPPRPARSDGASLLAPTRDALASVPNGPPVLFVTIDAEAEFDWNGPFLRTHTSVKNLRHQDAAQQMYDRFGVRPTYFVDYAAASQPEGYEPLRQIADSGRCEIGAHLQSWETPPFDEDLGERTSYNHNLPAWLQKEKLVRLTDMIVKNLGVRPIAYRAGRYGVGDEIARILLMHGYRIDMSVRPGIDLRRVYAPDFRRAPAEPYWFGPGRQLLEIPNTAAFVGFLASIGLPETFGVKLYYLLSRPNTLRVHAPGLFARLGLLERIFLSPEGLSFADLRRLTRTMIARGRRVFVLSYHSSSLLPGNTKYVQTPGDLSRFLGTIESYLNFFCHELGGRAMTPTEFLGSLDRVGAPLSTVDPVVSAAE